MRERPRSAVRRTCSTCYPDVFTRDEAVQMRVRQGVVHGTVANMLATWRKRMYIEPYGDEPTPAGQAVQRFAKTEAYLKNRR